MSKRTVLECDACGAECVYDTIYATVDRRMDAAGSMESVHEPVDLCYSCMRRQMAKMVARMTYEHARDWVKEARTKLKPVKM